jgi:hypothetical protein
MRSTHGRLEENGNLIQVGLKYPVRVGDLLVDKEKCELIGDGVSFSGQG